MGTVGFYLLVIETILLCLSEVELLDMANPDGNKCAALYGVLVPFIFIVLCNIGCAIRLIRNRDVCNHRNHRKQTEASVPNSTYDPVEINSQAEENSGYLELGNSDYRELGNSDYRELGNSDYREQGNPDYLELDNSGYKDLGNSGYREQGNSDYRELGNSDYLNSGYQDLGNSGYRELGNSDTVN
uniref:Uncharacterized protein LOC111111591 n=1 Tax=Crassostrea virginica TaxID=6565 RepID=A0A8B8BM12_CRAVI|nr:uncharacterized protein LOC111111591 [Crassostrea virginica]